MTMQFSPGQQQLLSSASEAVLVRGGPGSGKTTIGLLKAKAFFEKGMVDHQSVLFLSFSNGAVSQIQRAARIKLSTEERRAISIQTFHSFCWGILRCYGNIVGMCLPLTTVAPEEEAVRRAGLSPETWNAQRQGMAITEGKVAFDLFAKYTADIFDRCEEVRKLYASCYPLVIVDEFQDTDDEQWRVVDGLTRGSNMIALADLHQRIYDFRPGVRADRLEHFVRVRGAQIIDLGEANHRSPNHDILRFADHVLNPERGTFPVKSVAVQTYKYSNQCAVQLKWAVRNSEKAVRRIRGDGPVTILILGAANRTVQQVSQWLLKETEKAPFTIRHDVWVDSDELACAWYVLLAGLESGHRSDAEDIAAILGRLSDLQRCRATAGTLEDSDRILCWREEVISGARSRKVPLVSQLQEVLDQIKGAPWTGDPLADIDRVFAILMAATDKRIEFAMELCAVRRPARKGDAASTALERLFREGGTYKTAVQQFQRSLQQDRMSDRFVSLIGCNVMTLHKCKGKEFDAVIILDGTQEPHRLVCRGDQAPFERSRRLLRVGITRARFHAVIFTPESDVCPLLPRSV
jgi:DNA helicase II / ATP-dependent DNA helicase PcrA